MEQRITGNEAGWGTGHTKGVGAGGWEVGGGGEERQQEGMGTLKENWESSGVDGKWSRGSKTAPDDRAA